MISDRFHTLTEGLAPWRKALRDLESRMLTADLDSAFQKADEEFSAGFERNFAFRVDHEGMPWPPHAPATIAMYGPHPLLILTGVMYNALVTPGAPGHKAEISGDSMLVGIYGDHAPYAIFHHVGTSRMPRRRVVYASDLTVEFALAAFSEEVYTIVMVNFGLFF